MNIFFASCGDCCLGLQSEPRLMMLNCIELLYAKSAKWQACDSRRKLDGFACVVQTTRLACV